jgi:hypothetical protein
MDPQPGQNRRNRSIRQTLEGAAMNLKQTAKLMTFGTILTIAASSAPLALADDTGLDPFSKALAMMADKNGMVSKKKFMAMMEKRFDMMDKNKIGMISKEAVMAIFSDKP